MHRSRMIMLLAMSVFVGACQKKDAPEASQDIVPQAKPVVILLQATKAGDLELLKTAFSVRMKSKLDENGWDELLKTYQGSFNQEFGEYQIDEFSFEFAGSETEGQVSVVYNGKEFPSLYVIKEEAGWRLNES
jgi:hypothetical protein